MLNRWLSPRSLMLHLAIVVWVLACVVAAKWQVDRAIGGNAFSYLYAIEWPVFAVFGVYCWWAVVHADPAERALRAARREQEEATLAEEAALKRDRASEDAELAAYNDHLARLASSGRKKSWRH